MWQFCPAHCQRGDIPVLRPLRVITFPICSVSTSCSPSRQTAAAVAIVDTAELPLMSCSWTNDGVNSEGCGSCSDGSKVPNFEEVSSPVLSIPFWIEDPNFCGEQDEFACNCRLRLARRVAFQGVDLGRRFVSCPKVDDSTCGFMVWIDPEHSVHVQTGLNRL